MSLRSDYEERWYNPLTAAIVLTFDMMREHGYTVPVAARAAAVVFKVSSAEVRDVIAETTAEAMKRLTQDSKKLGGVESEQ